MEPELKPCPFCGGEAELVHHECKMNDIKIQCTKCGIKTGWWMGEPAELIEQWNTRVTSYNDPLHYDTLRDRDRYHEMADELADAIAKHFGVEIGEHSNMNCPWENALEWIAPSIPVKDSVTGNFLCGQCGEKVENWDYCPNCGQCGIINRCRLDCWRLCRSFRRQ